MEYPYSKIGNYKGLNIYLTDREFYIESVAQQIPDTKIILIHRNAYNLFQQDARFISFLETVLEHEYCHYLARLGKEENPDAKERTEKEWEVLQFLKSKGYFTDAQINALKIA